jgi:stage II sporulation protein AA (anti-sigma F factor antagonist)
MADDFSVHTAESRDRVAVVRVGGRLDARTAPRLLSHCLEARPPGGHLVLNLAEVTFLSSSGVGVLLVLSEKVRADEGSLRLASPSPAVKAPLELLNLHRFLALDESEGDALAALGT